METNTLISPRILTGSPLSHARRKRVYGFVLPSSLPPVELRIEEQRGDGAHSESPYLPAAPNPYNHRPANDYWCLGARSPCWNLSLSLGVVFFERRRHELLCAMEGSESSMKHSWVEAQPLQNGRPQSAQPILGHKRG